MDETNTSQKSISNEYWNNIFRGLIKIENHVRLATEGCESLLDYIQQTDKNLDEIKYKNYQLFMIEFKLVLDSIKNFIDPKEYKSMNEKLRKIDKAERKLKGLMKITSDARYKMKEYKLKPQFDAVIRLMIMLRGDLLSSKLWNMISPIAEDSF